MLEEPIYKSDAFTPITAWWAPPTMDHTSSIRSSPGMEEIKEKNRKISCREPQTLNPKPETRNPGRRDGGERGEARRLYIYAYQHTNIDTQIER
jgi:hypothetical protein